jgi:cytochrome c oxidase cbb3-type subunit 3
MKGQGMPIAFGLRLLLALSLASISFQGCRNAPGRPRPDSQVVPPSKVLDFDVLYAQNCAGCHGANGTGGASIALNNPIYLALADDATIRRVTVSGVAGTMMPAFGESTGGTLTDEQVGMIVRGIRERWSKPGLLRDMSPPPYSSPMPGDPSRGSSVYATYCLSCHGPSGKGGPKASPIVQGSFLALISDQELRTIVIVGRPDLGAPDWRDDVPGKPMSAQDVSDVVAWLSAQRPQFPGQPYASVQSPGGSQ